MSKYNNRHVIHPQGPDAARAERTNQSCGPEIPSAPGRSISQPRRSAAGGWEGWVDLGVDSVTGGRRRTRMRATTWAEVAAKLDRLVAEHATRTGKADQS